MDGVQPRDQRRRAWILTMLSAGLVGGVYLVLWAAEQGLAPDAAVSAYHLPAYLSLVVLLIWGVLAASRAFRLGPERSDAWPLND